MVQSNVDVYHLQFVVFRLNDLIAVLRSSNIGRYGNHYMGVYCYADDLSL